MSSPHTAVANKNYEYIRARTISPERNKRDGLFAKSNGEPGSADRQACAASRRQAQAGQCLANARVF